MVQEYLAILPQVFEGEHLRVLDSRDSPIGTASACVVAVLFIMAFTVSAHTP